MKTNLFILMMGISCLGFSQTTIFQDNFENGETNWQLNTTDLNSNNLHNKWVINNIYAGGQIAGVPCYPTGHATPATTASQPTTISNANGNYLHITSISGSTTAFANSHVHTPNEFCPFTEANFVKMANPISTVGYSDVQMSFWHLAKISASTIYGSIHYSLDGGQTWIQEATGLNNSAEWTQKIYTNTAWNNVQSLLFGFKFHNGTAWDAQGSAFSIDDFKITGEYTGPTISIGSLEFSTFCNGSDNELSVSFNVSGNMNTGNTYSVELSDETGSFALPTVIGSINSMDNGGLFINATIPSSTPVGTGYKVRVVASNPAISTLASAESITILQTPTVTASAQDTIICVGNNTFLTATGATSYTWTPASTLSAAAGSSVAATPTTTTQYTVTGMNGSGCSATAQVTVTVSDCASVENGSSNVFSIYPNPANSKISISSADLVEISFIKILDATGKMVVNVPNNSSEISIESLENGKYMLVIEHTNGKSINTFVKM